MDSPASPMDAIFELLCLFAQDVDTAATNHTQEPSFPLDAAFGILGRARPTPRPAPLAQAAFSDVVQPFVVHSSLGDSVEPWTFEDEFGTFDDLPLAGLGDHMGPFASFDHGFADSVLQNAASDLVAQLDLPLASTPMVIASEGTPEATSAPVRKQKRKRKRKRVAHASAPDQPPTKRAREEETDDAPVSKRQRVAEADKTVKSTKKKRTWKRTAKNVPPSDFAKSLSHFLQRDPLVGAAMIAPTVEVAQSVYKCNVLPSPMYNAGAVLSSGIQSSLCLPLRDGDNMTSAVVFACAFLRATHACGTLYTVDDIVALVPESSRAHNALKTAVAKERGIRRAFDQQAKNVQAVIDNVGPGMGLFTHRIAFEIRSCSGAKTRNIPRSSGPRIPCETDNLVRAVLDTAMDANKGMVASRTSVARIVVELTKETTKSLGHLVAEHERESINVITGLVGGTGAIPLSLIDAIARNSFLWSPYNITPTFKDIMIANKDHANTINPTDTNKDAFHLFVCTLREEVLSRRPETAALLPMQTFALTLYALLTLDARGAWDNELVVAKLAYTVSARFSCVRAFFVSFNASYPE